MSVAFIGMYLVVSGSVTMTTIAVIDDGGATGYESNHCHVLPQFCMIFYLLLRIGCYSNVKLINQLVLYS